MSAKYFDNKYGFLEPKKTEIKPVRQAPKNLDIQIAKLDSFIKAANNLLNKSRIDTVKIKQIQTNDYELQKYSYYMSSITAQQATQLLKELKEDGTFLIRKSSTGNPEMQPFSLSVVYKMEVYHLKIRKIDENLYTIGEPKEDELYFYCVNDIVEYFIENEIAIKNVATFRLRLNKNLKSTWEIHSKQII